MERKFEDLIEKLRAINSQGNSSFTELLAVARVLKEHYGYSNWDGVITKLNRERLQTPRAGQRIRYPWSEYRKLYQLQNGICPICDNPMVLLKNGDLQMDHIDPTAADFESRSNRRVTHKRCNQEKGPNSIEEESKRTGKPFTEILK